LLLPPGPPNRQQQEVIEYLRTENQVLKEKLGKKRILLSDTTVSNILKSYGIDPAPDRKRTGSWATFLKSHWDVLAAIDFTSMEVWTRHGLVTFYLLFVMELKTRRVHFAGCTTNPGEDWLKQTARDLTNHEDGFLNGKKHSIMDRDTKFSESFRSFLSDEGVEPVRLPPRSPDINAHLERFFGSLKSECLNRLILFGEKAMRNAVNQYLEHCHAERPHQGLGNDLIVPMPPSPSINGKIEAAERLGGLLRSYRRAA
jgi:transposase InsO family protein